MGGIGWIATVAFVWLAAAAATRVLAFDAFWRVLAAGAEAPGRAPNTDTGVALLRPVFGAPSRFEECQESVFRAALAADRPVRVIVGAERRDDPALDAVARLQAAHPGVTCDVRVGEGPPGSNRKIANLVGMSQEAREGILVLGDSDIRVPEDYVTRILAPFDDPEVGLVTCPYRSVAARGLTSRLDALITNLHFLPSTCLAVRIEGLHFGLGATIALRRASLERAGGFEALLNEPADDYRLARNVEAAGSRLAWCPMLVDHMLEREGPRATAGRHLRWCGTMRSVRKAGYLGLGVTHGLAPALMLWCLTPASGWLILGFWWLLITGLAWTVRERLQIGILDIVLTPLADAMAFFAWIGGFFQPAGGPTGAVVDRR